MKTMVSNHPISAAIPNKTEINFISFDLKENKNPRKAETQITIKYPVNSALTKAGEKSVKGTKLITLYNSTLKPNTIENAVKNSNPAIIPCCFSLFISIV